MYYKSNKDFVRRQSYVEFASSDHLMHENELLREDNRRLRKELDDAIRYKVLQTFQGTKTEVHTIDDIHNRGRSLHGTKRS